MLAVLKENSNSLAVCPLHPSFSEAGKKKRGFGGNEFLQARNKYELPKNIITYFGIFYIELVKNLA